MTGLRAWRYDGRTSGSTEVRLQLAGEDRIVVRGAAFERDYALGELEVSARVGSARRTMRFPDGSLCEVEDSDAVDALFSGHERTAFHRLLHKWESRAGYIAAALALTVAVLWAAVEYGVPALARYAAFAVPPAAEDKLGDYTLDGLDRAAFAPSQLPAARQAQLSQLFAAIVRALPHDRRYRLELRSSPRTGPNAFALPGGIIVLTDELVHLARNDEELAAVLAHEAGHVLQRHTLRHALQDSFVALLVIAVSGDPFSLTTLAAALPATLLYARFSRAFEIEADEFAVDYMKRHGISTQRFADILERLAAEDAGRPQGLDFLSTHPGVAERITRLARPAPSAP